MTTPNNNGVFDLDAARAARDEADETPFDFTLGGEKFTLPPQRQWSAKAAFAMSRGRQEDFADAMQELIGEDQLNRLLDAGLQLGDIEILFDEIARRGSGTDLPNSSAPKPQGTTRT